MPNQQFNQKYILIILISAFLVGGGILTYQYWWLPKQETKLPEITVQDETANWQTYQNKEYGYEFKYPQACSIAEYNAPEAVSLFCETGELNEKGQYILSGLYFNHLDNLKDNDGNLISSVQKYAEDSGQTIVYKDYLERIPDEPNKLIVDVPALEIFRPSCVRLFRI